MSGRRYTIAVDFDGVIHSYCTPWINAHTIPDPPVAGAVAWLHSMLPKFDVVIFSTRCRTWRGRRAIRRWLQTHGIGWREIRLSYKKIPALVYLDDRAMRFAGTFPSTEDIHNARPWNKPRAARSGGKEE